MKCEIITIGDEILIGQILNTNSQWIANQLSLLGVSITSMQSIADDHSIIQNCLKRSLESNDLIIITGGLGPTNDDITKKSLCEFFGGKMVRDQQTYEDVKAYIESRGRTINEINAKQADVPDNCKILRNLSGTAPGMWFEMDGKIVISLPGVPYEMEHIMKEKVLKIIEPIVAEKSGFLVYKTVLTHGLPESLLAEKIQQWENQLPSNAKLAYLPSPGIVRLRLNLYGNDKEILNNSMEDELQKLGTYISDNIFGYGDDTIEAIIGKLLLMRNASICTAESCTGGNIAKMITSISGSSEYYKGSIVAYSNKVKIRALSVNEETIMKHGAVSQQCVEEMSKGALEMFDTEYAIAVSGIAGPCGGTAEKKVGTIWIAIANKEFVWTEKLVIGADRIRNIQIASVTALNMLRKFIIKKL